MTVMSPSAPPGQTAAPVSPAPATASPLPVGTALVDVNTVAAAIVESSDPAAMLIHLLRTVSSRSATAPEQGALLSAVEAGCKELLLEVRATLLASVANEPGVYNGFEVFARAGSRRVDYDRLQAQYPRVFGEVVTVGSPTLAVRYTAD